MDTLVISTPREDTTGVLIHNEHLTVHHDVVFVLFEQRFSLNSIVEERNQGRIDRLIEVIYPEIIFHRLNSGF